MDFYTSVESSGISSLLNFHETHKSSYQVIVKTLDTVIEENKINSIKLIKIDVEGFDFFVLKGIDLIKNSSIEVIMCEFEDDKFKKVGYLTKDIINYLIFNGFQVIVSEWMPIIQYGGKHKFNKAFLYSGELDSKAWGNLIAFRNNNEFGEYVLDSLNN